MQKPKNPLFIRVLEGMVKKPFVYKAFFMHVFCIIRMSGLSVKKVFCDVGHIRKLP
jgi:hypothetical protein